MATLDLPYLNLQKDRLGRVRYGYFRRHGKRIKLPGEPGSVAFMRAYEDALALSEAQEEPALLNREARPGSFAALLQTYYRSPEFKAKKPSTRKEYRRVLDALAKRHGHKIVRGLTRDYIRKMRDEKADTPGEANNIIKTLKLVLSFAVEEGVIDANPAARMRLFKGNEYRPWSDEELDRFRARWPVGTMERIAFALALYTGQRRGDLTRMTRAHRKDGYISVTQGKTGEELWVKEHSDLTAELDAADMRHMSMLHTTRGKSFDPVYFGASFACAIDAAGLPDECVLHGLRKTAAMKLAEAGCTEEQIKAITGHRTTRMIEHYVKGANQKRLSTAAILKLENAK